MADQTNFSTPVGRYVNGSHDEPRTKDVNGRPIDPDKQRYEFGVAFNKDDPAFPQLFQTLYGAAAQGYANNQAIMARIQQWATTLDGFSGKLSDGDKPNAKGEVNKNTAGKFVLYFSSAYAPNCCDHANTQIEPSGIKRGDYVDVAGTAAINGLVDHNAGLYINPVWLRLREYGERIGGGVSADTAFGSAAAAPSNMPAQNAGPLPSQSGAAGVPGVPGVGNAPAPAQTPTAPAATPPVTPGVAPQTASPTEQTQYPAYTGAMTPPGVPGQS